jgi:hypothetical protein
MFVASDSYLSFFVFSFDGCNLFSVELHRRLNRCAKTSSLEGSHVINEIGEYGFSELTQHRMLFDFILSIEGEI